MARLLVCLGLLTLLSLIPLSYQGDPTYSECKPHIDATIYDLAAKAIHAGVQSDEADTSAAQQSEQPAYTAQPVREVPPSPPTEPVHYAPAAPPEPAQYTPPIPPEYVQQAPPEPAQIPPPVPPPYQQAAQQTFSPPSQYAQPAAQQAPVYQTQTTESLGAFDKFVKFIFQIEFGPRDPKYAQPWNTHPEFIKKVVSVEESKKVEVKPNIISRFINTLVSRIFNAPDAPRDAKWAQPWKTHEEHIKKEESSDKPKPKQSGPGIFSRFVNKFVEIVFGKDTVGPRDPKWAEPWQTHKEHKKAPKTEVKEKPKVSHDKGGLINSFVTLFFEAPTVGERDIKWSQPWQTHPEHKKEAKTVQEAGSKAPKPREPGFISKGFNKFVSVIFGEISTAPRDPKWNQPWQTHPEFAKKKTVETEAPVKKQEPSDFLGLRSFVNKLVGIIFGQSTVGERDPKWSQPWQTHERPGGKAVPTQQTSPPPSPPKAAAPTPEPVSPPVTLVPSPPPSPKVVPPPPPPPPPKVAQAPPPPPPPPKVIPAPQPLPPREVSEPSPPPVAAPAPPSPSHPKEEKVPTPPKEKKVESFHSDSEAGTRDRAPSPPERVVSTPPPPVKQVLEEVAPEREPQKEKIIEDEEQIVVVPSAFRPRDHIDSILGLDETSKLTSARTDPIADSTLRDLKKLYETAVKPLELTYKYPDISNRHLSDAELFGTPLILMLGPYSTGKSTFINYLLGVEFTKKALKTGTPPSHGVFRIVKYGDVDRDLDGTDLSGHWSFGFLQKFGQNFVDQLKGKELNSPLLKKVTFVEAPGILEMRRPGERLYPFNDVVQWFIDRADLILVMFDYTKLDAGYEMEAVLDQLKGREAQTRILLNKADQVPPEELIKVQGSLFWNLSPLLGVSAPPIVYAGSFSSLHYRPSSPMKLFQAQEEALLHDISQAISARVDNRIAIARRHAVRVRNHAQMVDTYLTTFYKNKGFLTSKHKLAEEIVENPHAYNIYEGVSLLTNISRYDLPDAEVYRDFFRIHNLYSFRTLRETCTFLAGCPIEKLDTAINKHLPELMDKYRRLVGAAAHGNKLPDANIRPGGVGSNVAHAHHSKS